MDVAAFSKPNLDLLKTLPGQPEAGSYYLCLGELVSYKRVDLAVKACTAPVGSSSYLVKGKRIGLKKWQADVWAVCRASCPVRWLLAFLFSGRGVFWYYFA